MLVNQIYGSSGGGTPTPPQPSASDKKFANMSADYNVNQSAPTGATFEETYIPIQPLRVAFKIFEEEVSC